MGDFLWKIHTLANHRSSAKSAGGSSPEKQTNKKPFLLSDKEHLLRSMNYVSVVIRKDFWIIKF